MKPKSVILLSGGLDSTVSATIARRRTRPLFALTFDYGQRAAKMEVAASRKISRILKIKHKVVRLPFFAEFSSSMLSRAKKISVNRFSKIKDLWLPNRNGLFINIAACYAEYYGAEIIVAGFNLEEAREFPDNSASFINAVNKSLRFGTLSRVTVKSYVSTLTKKEIYDLGLRSSAPLELVYSCYLGRQKMCGKCASCKRLIEASRCSREKCENV